MKAVHIRTEGIDEDGYELAFVEMFVRLIDGVKDVASVRALHLVSVLYDETVADITDILASIRRAGFRAYLYRPQGSPLALAATSA